MANYQAGRTLSDWYGCLARFACWAAATWSLDLSYVLWLPMHFLRMAGKCKSVIVDAVLTDKGNGLVSTECVYHLG